MEHVPYGRWADDVDGHHLDKAALEHLTKDLGAGQPWAPADPDAADVPPSRLTGAARAALAHAVGAGGVDEARETRLALAGGQSFSDLAARRNGRLAVPDAVVRPADAAAVVALLRAASEHGVAVVPRGGGTSVVGGLDAVAGGHSAVVLCDLGRMAGVVAVDPLSLTATVEAGTPTPQLEAELARQGLTLGHAPQSWLRATAGGYAATRSAGQASTGIGRFEDLVVGLTLATPSGLLELPALPASAVGPDLRRLVVGSEGVLGVITRVVLRVRPVPTRRSYAGWVLPSFAAGLEVLRGLAQRGVTPDVLRLSDAAETRASLALSGPRGAARLGLDGWLRLRRVAGEPALVVVGAEGDPEDVEHRLRVAARALRGAGAAPLGARAGRSWERGRFGGPFLRDELLDHGYLVETLETAALWSRLPDLHHGVVEAVAEALHAQGTPAIVGAHVSHVYATGASVYLTAIARRRPGAEAEQWAAAKRAAGDAIARLGGTATHHHAVGRDHVPWAAAEMGALGVQALRAVKAAWDPAGVLNPGVLLPDPVRA